MHLFFLNKLRLVANETVCCGGDLLLCKRQSLSSILPRCERREDISHRGKTTSAFPPYFSPHCKEEVSEMTHHISRYSLRILDQDNRLLSAEEYSCSGSHHYHKNMLLSHTSITAQFLADDGKRQFPNRSVTCLVPTDWGIVLTQLHITALVI
jgi:hypothetical protein